MTESNQQHDDLQHRLAKWLSEEGYPLEFRTAHEFGQAGFEVRQGGYIRSRDGSPPREIDVQAFKSLRSEGMHLRVYHIVECKWSGQKPWVVFTAERGIMPTACVAQTFGSLLGNAILWTEAGCELLHSLDLFSGSPAHLVQHA
jgi:hypothetical protein